jgi:hypothetical protein
MCHDMQVSHTSCSMADAAAVLVCPLHTSSSKVSRPTVSSQVRLPEDGSTRISCALGLQSM